MGDPESILARLTSLVIGAGESIDIIASLDPRTRVGSELSHSLGTMTALADQRLRLRCIIHWPTDPSARTQVRADSFGEEISSGGWEVRTVPTRPSVDLIVVDGEVTHAIFDNGQEIVTSSDKDEKIVGLLLAHFEELWSVSADTSGPKQLLFEDLIRPSIPFFERNIVQLSNETWDQLIAHLARFPEGLFELQPRKFEELVAELLAREGMQVQLTPESRDGGRDILALHDGPAGQHLYLVECKRYAADRPVGVELVRSLYGVMERERATSGMLVTTSRFTKDAFEFMNPIRYRMSLKEFEDLKMWLGRYG